VTVPLEQSPEWAEFERSQGRTPWGIVGYFDGGRLAVVASYLHSTRRLRESMVVVNGPVWFIDRTAAAEARLLDTVRTQFAAEPGIDPVFVRLQMEHPLPGVRRALEPGWYDREIVVDLRPDEKALLAGFRPNARQSIRKATRAGVETRIIDRTERAEVFARELFPIMAETSARDGFTSFGAPYYQGLLRELDPYTELFVAYLDGTAVSWLITTEYRGHAVYYFAASSAAARQCFAPYLLLWESFRFLKARGNTACGLTGIVSDTWPSLANVTTFKRNFSKNEVDLPTTMDVPLKAVRYAAVAAALGLRRRGPAAVRTAAAAAAKTARSVAGRRPPGRGGRGVVDAAADVDAAAGGAGGVGVGGLGVAGPDAVARDAPARPGDRPGA
jgi:hypothetical protein